VVVEAGFASTLGLHVGDRLNLGGPTFRVVGTAVTAVIPAYPNTRAQAEGCILTNAVAHTNPGLVWATQVDAMHIAGGGRQPDLSDPMPTT
jgi:putative ABC transport system permease protein